MTANPIPNGDQYYFDALARVGPRGAKHVELPWRLDQLCAEMDHCSISAALVWSAQGSRYDAMFDNLRLSAEIADHPRLFAGWNVMPDGTGEFPDPEALLTRMREVNVRAVCIHPRTNAWDPLGNHARPLFAALRTHAIPLFVHRSEIESWRQLDLLLAENRGLAFVLSGASWSEQRYLIPLLKEYPELHITAETLQMNQGVEDLFAWNLGKQLIFGTNAPAMSAGAHRSYIDYADVPPENKAAAAAGNLLRLLNLTDPPPIHTNPNDDALMTAAKAGQPLPIPVVDAHMHILDEGLNGGGWHFRMSGGSPSKVFPKLNRLGVVGGGFMSWSGTVSGDSIAGNRCVQAALNAAPPGFWGLATFDPCQYRNSELERMIPAFYDADQRFIGMKPYFIYGLEYHHPSYDVWWKYGNRHRLYAGLHRVRNDYLEVSTLAAKYPEVRWVVFHCGSDYAAADGVIECMKRFPNVYAEITYTSVTGGIIDYLVNETNGDRVLYGSDLPMRDPTTQLGWVIYSRLSYEQKCRVLYGNTHNLIAPCLNRLPEKNRPGSAGIVK